MAKDSGSLYVPAETPTQPEPRRYDILARNAGWTKEKLRKCYEIPRKLPSHVRHIKMTSEVLQVSLLYLITHFTIINFALFEGSIQKYTG